MKTIAMLLMAAFSIASVNCFPQEKAGKKDTASHNTYYTCPVHDTVLVTKAGYCPICGMKLQLAKKELMKNETVKSYTCPMHPDVISANPGKCPKCGSSLVPYASPKEKMKMEAIKTYSCPMHPDVISEKPGKCPKCGMTLVEVKATNKS